MALILHQEQMKVVALNFLDIQGELLYLGQNMVLGEVALGMNLLNKQGALLYLTSSTNNTCMKYV